MKYCCRKRAIKIRLREERLIMALVQKTFSGDAEKASKLIEQTLRLQLHGAIYCPDSFVLMLRYCANMKAIRYESTSLNRIVADKSHRVIVA